MSSVSRRFAMSAVVLWCLLNLTVPVQAGYVPFWSLSEIADKAEVLVAGEVVEVTTGREIAAQQGTRRIPVRRQRATIRVLRSSARPARNAPQSTPVARQGISLELQEIKVESKTLDWSKISVLTDARAMSIPRFAVGQRLVFPLRKAASGTGAGTDETWHLIGEDGTNLLLPATVDGLSDAQPRTSLAFLQAELAAGLIKGQYSDLKRTVGYLFNAESESHGAAAKKPLDAIYEDVARHIGNDEVRWRDIAVVSYNQVSHCTPRSSIARMRTLQAGQRPCTYWPLTSQALRHMGAHNFDDQLVAGLVEHGAATSLAENYPLHPATLKFFSAGLEEGRPEALERVLYLLNNIC